MNEKRLATTAEHHLGRFYGRLIRGLQNHDKPSFRERLETCRTRDEVTALALEVDKAGMSPDSWRKFHKAAVTHFDSLPGPARDLLEPQPQDLLEAHGWKPLTPQIRKQG